MGTGGWTKRVFDIVVASLLLVVLSPVLLAVAVLVRLKLGSPVLFRQERPGLHGRPFLMTKFRSMKPGDGLDEERLTKFGRILRAASLDELPELWNVLRGEMSLVGPRPEEAWLVKLYNDRQRRRLAVKPGMTGPMQVNGRADLSFAQRLDLELDYIEHYSLRRDIAILLKTIPVVLRGNGAY